MTVAIQIIWAIGLLGALAATLAILKMSQLVIRALIDIAKLAGVIEQATHGIAANLAPIATLPDMRPLGETLTSSGRGIAGALDAIARRVERA